MSQIKLILALVVFLDIFFFLCVGYPAQFINLSNPTKAVFVCIPDTTECALIAEVDAFSSSGILDIPDGCYIETRCTNRDGLFIIHPIRYHRLRSDGIHEYRI